MSGKHSVFKIKMSVGKSLGSHFSLVGFRGTSRSELPEILKALGGDSEMLALKDRHVHSLGPNWISLLYLSITQSVAG